jgi:putative hemolysin
MWLGGVVLLVLAALVRGSLEAISASSRIRLHHLADENAPGSAVTTLYLEHPEYFRAALFAWECALAATGALLFATASLGDGGPGVAAGILILMATGYAMLSAISGSIARHSNSRLLTLLAPVVAPLARFSLSLTGPRSRAESEAAEAPGAEIDEGRETVEELIEEGVREGIGDTEDMLIVHGVVELRDTLVKEVMVPRAEVFALPADLPTREIAEQIAASGYSRVPIYGGTLDSIAGIYHVLDVLKYGAGSLPPLRQVVTASESERCSELLIRMLRQQSHICVVSDDAGHTAGIITLEDLLEEIVGEIRDEFDEPASVPTIGLAGQEEI